ncbi:MAG TPA: DUF308 domain-containing protein [Gemmatimonadales bacterium]|nr:DUF308 domain-containing protein [Gemmatimonadales bacterium]
MEASPLTPGELHELTWGWWLAIVLGVLSMVAGAIVLAKPSDSLETLAVVSGIFVLLDGIFELVAALSSRTENRGLAAILGVVSVIVGMLLIRHPIGGVTAIALLLASWLIAAAIVRLVFAFERPEHRVRGIIVAVALGAAGILIVASPNIGYATLALFAGLGFIAYGAGMIALGWAMHTVRRVSSP